MRKGETGVQEIGLKEEEVRDKEDVIMIRVQKAFFPISIINIIDIVIKIVAADVCYCEYYQRFIPTS